MEVDPRRAHRRGAEDRPGPARRPGPGRGRGAGRGAGSRAGWDDPLKEVVFAGSAATPAQFPGDGLAGSGFPGPVERGQEQPAERARGQSRAGQGFGDAGRTRLVNFFRVGNELYLADLPGYGYAKVPESMRREWEALAVSYLVGAKALGAVRVPGGPAPRTDAGRRLRCGPSSSTNGSPMSWPPPRPTSWGGARSRARQRSTRGGPAGRTAKAVLRGQRRDESRSRRALEDAAELRSSARRHGAWRGAGRDAKRKRRPAGPVGPEGNERSRP